MPTADVVPELAEDELEAAEDDVSELVGKTTPVEEEVAVLGSSVKRTLVGDVDVSVLADDEAAADVLGSAEAAEVLEPAEGLAGAPAPADGVANAVLGLEAAEDPADPAAPPVGLPVAKAPKEPDGGV